MIQSMHILVVVRGGQWIEVARVRAGPFVKGVGLGHG